MLGENQIVITLEIEDLGGHDMAAKDQTVLQEAIGWRLENLSNLVIITAAEEPDRSFAGKFEPIGFNKRLILTNIENINCSVWQMYVGSI